MAKFYNDREAILNNDLYFDLFEKRGVKHIKITRTKISANSQAKNFKSSKNTFGLKEILFGS